MPGGALPFSWVVPYARQNPLQRTAWGIGPPRCSAQVVLPSRGRVPLSGQEPDGGKEGSTIMASGGASCQNQGYTEASVPGVPDSCRQPQRTQYA